MYRPNYGYRVREALSVKMLPAHCCRAIIKGTAAISIAPSEYAWQMPLTSAVRLFQKNALSVMTESAIKSSFLRDKTEERRSTSYSSSRPSIQCKNGSQPRRQEAATRSAQRGKGVAELPDPCLRYLFKIYFVSIIMISLERFTNSPISSWFRGL